MTSNDLRCPQCSAHVAPHAEWCTLCYADLRAPAAPEPEPVPVAGSAGPAAAGSASAEPSADPADGDAAEAERAAARARGKHARPATTYDDAPSVGDVAPAPGTAAADGEIEARAEAMLALLAAETKSTAHPLVGRLNTSKARVTAGLVGGLAIVVVGVLVMTLLGMLA